LEAWPYVFNSLLPRVSSHKCGNRYCRICPPVCLLRCGLISTKRAYNHAVFTVQRLVSSDVKMLPKVEGYHRTESIFYRYIASFWNSKSLGKRIRSLLRQLVSRSHGKITVAN